ncbi:histidine-containing phosphotransfer protein 1-like [Lycium barbarum]|uniref:histidine-containing phosphotransfer protein 1-like n=1 Tax=Lycium barbarum TaxID=112863 RepID=UPI00293E7A65|nr:histidine-containing phosphotransfer protein 1-like [Lycium barbarum]
MALRILTKIQLALLNQMLKKGLVNNEFEHLMIAKRAQNPQFVIQTIEEYGAEVEAIMSQMKNDIDIPDVDFSHLVALCDLVREKSTRIGAAQVNSACMLLVRACEQRNKKKFSQTLELLRNDFSTTQSQLEGYARMERRIIIVQRGQVGSSSS